MYAFVFVIIALIFVGLTVFQMVAISLKSPYLLVVDGDSMYPTLKPNDLLFIERVSPNDISIGDIVVIDFGWPSDYLEFSTGYFVHRVVEIRERSDGLEVKTLGDNMGKRDDGFYAVKYVLGRLVYYVPFLGAVIAPPANFLIIIISIVLYSISRSKSR